MSKGYEVEKVFQDSFSGGGDFMNRPAMSELLKHVDAKAHVSYVVVFDDLKRFARDVQFHLKLRSAFKVRNVKVECLNYNFEDTPEGDFIEVIFAAHGELERKQNRRQVIQKQKARLERGYWPFYHPPGYISLKNQQHGQLLTIDEPNASIIREALEGFASGRFQEQMDVKNFLQSKDFYGNPTHGKRTKYVHLGQVKRLLVRVIYAGYIEYPDWEVSRRKGHHEALISLETHEKIMERLNGKMRIFSRDDTRADFPLRGFVQCDGCHKNLTASWSTGSNGRFAYYRCISKDCIEKNKSINRDKMHQDFIEILSKIKPKQQTLNLTREILLDMWNELAKNFGAERVKIEQRLACIERDINSIVKRIEATKSNKMVEIYEKQIEDLSNEELALKDKITSTESKEINFGTALDFVFDVLKNPYKVWEDGDLNLKRLILKLVFHTNISYSKNSGFGTAILSLPLRVFETFDVSISMDVEVARIELACNRVARVSLQSVERLKI